MARVKCKACKGKGYVEGPDVEVVRVDGIAYKINHWPGRGTTVETPCSCFGSERRAHSSTDCPWQRQRCLRRGNMPARKRS